MQRLTSVSLVLVFLLSIILPVRQYVRVRVPRRHRTSIADHGRVPDFHPKQKKQRGELGLGSQGLRNRVWAV